VNQAKKESQRSRETAEELQDRQGSLGLEEDYSDQEEDHRPTDLHKEESNHQEDSRNLEVETGHRMGLGNLEACCQDCLERQVVQVVTQRVQLD
jgi:hypothetical protein